MQGNEHEIKEIVVYETEQDKTDEPAGKEKAAHGPLPPRGGQWGDAHCLMFVFEGTDRSAPAPIICS